MECESRHALCEFLGPVRVPCMGARLVIVVAIVGAALVGTACVPPPGDDDRIIRYDPDENLMGVIQEEGVLRAGIEPDLGPWGMRDTGFTADLATVVAEALGVETEFVPAAAEEMPEMVAEGDIHIGFPMIPITEELLTTAGLSDPYWVGHQRLLVPDDSDVTAPTDLAGARVCSVVDEATGVAPPPGVEEITASDPSDCASAMTKGRAQAVIGPDVILIHLAAEVPGWRLAGEGMTTTGYGAVVGTGTGGFNAFVDTVLGEADRELTWADLYEQWITPVTGTEPPGYPTMTLEQAAALYPAEN